MEKYIDGDGEGKEGKEPAGRGAKRKADGEAATSASLDAASAAATSTNATSTTATSTAATSSATPTTGGMTKTLAATKPTR